MGSERRQDLLATGSFGNRGESAERRGFRLRDSLKWGRIECGGFADQATGMGGESAAEAKAATLGTRAVYLSKSREPDGLIEHSHFKGVGDGRCPASHSTDMRPYSPREVLM